jgi:hypothetical protein
MGLLYLLPYVQVCPLLRTQKHAHVTSLLGSTPVLRPMVAIILPKHYNSWLNIVMRAGNEPMSFGISGYYADGSYVYSHKDPFILT